MQHNAYLFSDLAWAARRARPALVLLYVLLSGLALFAITGSHQGVLLGVMAFDGQVMEQYLSGVNVIKPFGGRQYAVYQWSVIATILITKILYILYARKVIAGTTGWRLLTHGATAALAIAWAALILAGCLAITVVSNKLWNQHIVDPHELALRHFSFAVPTLHPHAGLIMVGLFGSMCLVALCVLWMTALRPNTLGRLAGHPLAILLGAVAVLLLTLSEPTSQFAPLHTSKILAICAGLWSLGALAGVAVLSPLQQIEAAGDTCPACGAPLAMDRMRDCPQCGSFLDYTRAS